MGERSFHCRPEERQATTALSWSSQTSLQGSAGLVFKVGNLEAKQTTTLEFVIWPCVLLHLLNFGEASVSAVLVAAVRFWAFDHLASGKHAYTAGDS